MDHYLLSEFNFTPYIPTTLLGFLGLATGYLYFYLTKKDKRSVEQLEKIPEKDRPRALEMWLNDVGITIDTKNLSNQQTLQLAKYVLQTKYRKYLVTSVVTVSISIIIAIVVSVGQTKPKNDTTSSSVDTKLEKKIDSTVMNPSGRFNSIPTTSETSKNANLQSNECNYYQKNSKTTGINSQVNGTNNEVTNNNK